MQAGCTLERGEQKGRSPWVDSACADSDQIVLLLWSWVLRAYLQTSVCCMAPGFAWVCCPDRPYRPCKQGTHNIGFYITREHTPVLGLQPPWPLTGVIRALRARNPKRAQKKFPGPLGPGVKKSRKEVVFHSFLTLF